MYHNKYSLRPIIICIVFSTILFNSLLYSYASPLPQSSEPVTLYLPLYVDYQTLDPQTAPDLTNNAYRVPIENLFLGLTDIDPKTGLVRPEAATEWQQNGTGDVWTFTLRDDIPWVKWDTKAQKATEVRKLTAKDFEYGIKRSCDPRVVGTNNYSTRVISAQVIKGCADVASKTPKEVTDAELDLIGVKALDPTHLEITATGPKGYLLTLTGTWLWRAVPEEVITKYGDQWATPANIVTNGPFVLDTWIKKNKAVFLRNPLYPKDVNDNYGGNIERVSLTFQSNANSFIALYNKSQIDTAPASPKTPKNEFVYKTVPTVAYLGFIYDKPPFDKVAVRRAFSAAIDRKGLVAKFPNFNELPIGHIMPPGVIGAVPIDEIGLGSKDNPGFDADYAKKQFAEAGYPDCKNFPDITLGIESDTLGKAIQGSLNKVLGCAPGKIKVQVTNFSKLIPLIRGSSAQRPNMFSISWGSDYPDAQNWMSDFLGCKSTENNIKRPCIDAIDTTIDAASKEFDAQKRAQMYRELETALFGENGEFPVAPLFVGVNILAVKPWYTGFFSTDSGYGDHWDSQKIDQAAQLAARNGKIKK